MAEPPNRPSEPEIIPPGAPLPYEPRVWMTSNMRGAQRVYTARIGPVGVALLALGIGAAAVLAIVVLLGAAVFGLAVIGALTLAGVIAGLLRGPSRPLR